MGPAGKSPPGSFGPRQKLKQDSRVYRSLLKSFACAYSGLSYVYTTQRNMRIHVFAGAVVGGASIFFGLDRVEILMLALAVAGVLIAEVVNTLAESITDLLEPEFSPVAKVVKDVAAAGVLLASLFSVLIGAIAFYPALCDLSARTLDFVESRAGYFGVYSVLIIVPAFLGLFCCKPSSGSTSRRSSRREP